MQRWRLRRGPSLWLGLRMSQRPGTLRQPSLGAPQGASLRTPWVGSSDPWLLADEAGQLSPLLKSSFIEGPGSKSLRRGPPGEQGEASPPIPLNPTGSLGLWLAGEPWASLSPELTDLPHQDPNLCGKGSGLCGEQTGGRTTLETLCPSVTLSTTKYCPTSSCRMGGVQAYTAWRPSWDICRSPTAALVIRVYFELDSPETRCWNLYGDNRLTPLSLSFLFCKWAY